MFCHTHGMQSDIPQTLIYHSFQPINIHGLNNLVYNCKEIPFDRYIRQDSLSDKSWTEDFEISEQETLG
jgi:hypothetical protein